MKPYISILIPTRNRGEQLVKSIKSLVENAAVPNRLEILIGIDNDDMTTRQVIETDLAPYLQEHQVECRANVFEPIGFTNMHQYVNTIANASTADWMCLWHDDALMLTKDWDEEIMKRDGEFKLLAFKDNHEDHPYAVCPVIPKDWYRLLEHISQHPQNDAWLSHIAYMLDIFERIDVEMLHDRADLTGNNDDDTFKNRKILEGNPMQAEDFGHPDMQQARVKTAYKVAWFLEKIGQPSQWWYDVLEGKQDPFAKMVFNDGTPLPPPGPSSEPAPPQEQAKERVSDDEKLVL